MPPSSRRASSPVAGRPSGAGAGGAIELRHNRALALLAVGENERAHAELLACLHSVARRAAVEPARWAACVGAIARGLRRLLADEGLRTRLGGAGRAHAVENTWERNAEQVLELYDRALEGRR